MTTSTLTWTSLLSLAALALLAGCGTSNEPASSTDSPDAEPVGLQARLDHKRDEFREKAPEETQKTYTEGIESVRRSGVMETALKPGATAPDFTLPDASGEKVTLSRLLAVGPVVLVWYRGGWCPYCNLTLRAYQDALPKIRARGATLVAISPETPDHSLTTKQKQQLDFVVLSDVGNKVARQYGIAFRLPDPVVEQFRGKLDIPAYNGDESWELPLSSTFVVDRGGTIRYAFHDADYKKRAGPADVLRVLDRLER